MSFPLPQMLGQSLPERLRNPVTQPCVLKNALGLKGMKKA